MFSYVLHQDPSSDLVGDYMMCSKREKLIDYNINTAVEVVTRGGVIGIVEETTEDAFKVGYHEHKEQIKTKVRNMVEATFTAFVGESSLPTISAWYLKTLTKFNRFMDALTP